MSRVVIFDSGILGLVSKPVKKSPTDHAASRWAFDLMASGNRIVVPALADYEIRRELVRIGSTRGIATLDIWNSGEPDRFLNLTYADLLLACDFWARARNAGMPTADPKELDGDVIIAAQAFNLGQTVANYIVATTIVGHLSLFVSADLWTNITP